MVTDEQLIEHLRSSMEAATVDLRPPPDLLNGIVARERRWWRLTPGGVAAGLATAVALFVAVLAVILLARGPATNPRIVVPQTVPTATSLPALRVQLAVLRRRQRPADRIPAWGIAAERRPSCSNCLNVATVMPRQTRLLATLPGPRSGSRGHRPERIYLVLGTVPGAWQDGRMSGWRQSRRATSGLHVSLVGFVARRPHQMEPTDELLNYSQLPMPAQSLTPRDVLITETATVGLIPDGVARVDWQLADPGQQRPVTVHPQVHGNVAVAAWTPAPRSTALVNEQLLVGATWYGADGQVLASFHDSLKHLDRVYVR